MNYMLKVSKSRKQFMVSLIFPKNEFNVLKIIPMFFLGRIICFWDCLTFSQMVHTCSNFRLCFINRTSSRTYIKWLCLTSSHAYCKKTKKSKRFKSRQLRKKRDQRPWPHMYVCSEKQVVRSSTYLNDC